MTPDLLSELARKARAHRLRVAVVVTDGATLIDFAGPWQIFVTTPEGRRPFRVVAVSTSRKPVTLGGGFIMVPEYTLKGAPRPDIVLVPALGYGPYPEIVEWIRRAHRGGALIVSVCVGAFQLAEAGILDGLPATTHHDFQKALQEQYPSVQVVGGLRFVKSSPSVYTAGGLTAGIDLALYLIGRIWGVRAAREIAKYQEYGGNGWETGRTRNGSSGGLPRDRGVHCSGHLGAG